MLKKKNRSCISYRREAHGLWKIIDFYIVFHKRPIHILDLVGGLERGLYYGHYQQNRWCYIVYWLVVWNIFYVSINIGNNDPNWRTHIFQTGWNHQPGMNCNDLTSFYITGMTGMCFVFFYIGEEPTVAHNTMVPMWLFSSMLAMLQESPWSHGGYLRETKKNNLII